jgi:hypothetical protein
MGQVCRAPRCRTDVALLPASTKATAVDLDGAAGCCELLA